MFRSFFMAGFEGATGWSHRGHWFDQVAATGHEKTVDADYKAISALGLHAAREAVRWPLVDKGRGVYDFSTLSPFLSANALIRRQVNAPAANVGDLVDIVILK